MKIIIKPSNLPAVQSILNSNSNLYEYYTILNFGDKIEIIIDSDCEFQLMDLLQSLVLNEKE